MSYKIGRGTVVKYNYNDGSDCWCAILRVELNPKLTVYKFKTEDEAKDFLQ